MGCGRGGGSRYIARHFLPESVLGLDLSTENLNTCRRKAKSPNLTYQEGDAEALPFEDSTFDIVINVESSHDYPNISRFFDGVRRVLKPGGYFIRVDYRTELGMFQLKANLCKYWDLELIHFQNITQNVVEALRLYEIPVRESIQKYFPEGPRNHLYSQWARLPGTAGFNHFRDRLEVYSSFIYRKEMAI